jgi:hypothetical protein
MCREEGYTKLNSEFSKLKEQEGDNIIRICNLERKLKFTKYALISRGTLLLLVLLFFILIASVDIYYNRSLVEEARINVQISMELYEESLNICKE